MSESTPTSLAEGLKVGIVDSAQVTRWVSTTLRNPIDFYGRMKSDEMMYTSQQKIAHVVLKIQVYCPGRETCHEDKDRENLYRERVELS